MADTKSAKLDQDFSLSPDDPLSKLANFFVVSDDPLGPKPAPEPVIDMEQELLPARDEGNAPFDAAGEVQAPAPAEPVSAQPPLSAWDSPEQARPVYAERAMQDERPDSGTDAGDAPLDEATALDAELDAEFAGLHWETDDTAEPRAFEPAVPDDAAFAPAGNEHVSEAGSFVAPQSWQTQAADTAEGPVPDALPGSEHAPDDMPETAAGSASAGFAPLPAGHAWQPPASGLKAWEPPASGLDEGVADDVLDEMMAVDWSSRSGEAWSAEQDGAGADAGHDGAEEAAFQPEFADEPFSTAAEDGGDWMPEEPLAMRDGGPDHAPPAPEKPLSFAATTIEDELAALLAGEPDNGARDDVPAPVAPAVEASGHGPDADVAGFDSHAGMPALDASEAAPSYQVSHATHEAARMSRQTNFGWALPPQQQPGWGDAATSHEAGATDTLQDEADPVGYAPATRPWNDGSPEPVEAAAKNAPDSQAGFEADDRAFEFEGAFTDDFDVVDAADLSASETAEELPERIEADEEPDIDLPEFDESAFLDQSFIEDDLRLDSEDPAPPSIPGQAAAGGEGDFDIDPDLLAEIESIQMEHPGEGDDYGYGSDGVELPDARDSASGSGQSAGGSAMRTGLAAGAAAAVGGLASRFSTGSRKSAAEPLPPEIETTDVPESRIDMADDLDLPETAYQTDSAHHAGPDDLEEMLAGQELSDTHVAAGQPQAAMDFETFFERELEDAGISFGAAKKPVHAPDSQATARLEEPVSVPVTPGAAQRTYDDVLHDEDLERELAFDDFAEPADEGQKSKRGLMIAAVVAGVALVGGIGAFALTGGGGDAGDTQAIVRADPEPVKVKPENPGGTKVPNQNRVVYEEAAGAPAGAEPQQDKLVSNAETPVDVRTRPVRVVSPGPVDAAAGGDSPANEPSGTAAPAAKSEDRIDPDRTAQEPGPSSELAAVAPRRVRTYVVRPDGTLVATEAPAPSGADIAATASPQAEAAATEQKAGEEAPATAAGIPVPQPRPQIGGETRTAGTAPAETAAPAPVTAAADTARTEAPGLQPRQVRTTTIRRDTVTAPPVVPERPADQPVNIVGTTRRDGQQVAAAPPAAQTGLANANPPAWVQIASQPSRELAQSSYRNLSQRFGSIIGGRGVNIVPAEIPGRGTFYRVNIPAGSFNEAASLCREIKAAGGDCLAKR
ncbi:SPOR domain-containing protein [Zhengella sp. ZM62]|uniref:SPOR domain-containing protein n=1 Tax=Zhengella sedimenti TaxID=3390035 RepID=UPI00397720E6